MCSCSLWKYLYCSVVHADIGLCGSTRQLLATALAAVVTTQYAVQLVMSHGVKQTTQSYQTAKQPSLSTDGHAEQMEAAAKMHSLNCRQ